MPLWKCTRVRYPTDDRLAGLLCKSLGLQPTSVSLGCQFKQSTPNQACCYGQVETSIVATFVLGLARPINPLSPSIKLKILLLCFHTFLTEVVGRSC